MPGHGARNGQGLGNAKKEGKSGMCVKTQIPQEIEEEQTCSKVPLDKWNQFAPTLETHGEFKASTQMSS